MLFRVDENVDKIEVKAKVFISRNVGSNSSRSLATLPIDSRPSAIIESNFDILKEVRGIFSLQFDNLIGFWTQPILKLKFIV